MVYLQLQIGSIPIFGCLFPHEKKQVWMLGFPSRGPDISSRGPLHLVTGWNAGSPDLLTSYPDRLGFHPWPGGTRPCWLTCLPSDNGKLRMNPICQSNTERQSIYLIANQLTKTNTFQFAQNLGSCFWFMLVDTSVFRNYINISKYIYNIRITSLLSQRSKSWTGKERWNAGAQIPLDPGNSRVPKGQLSDIRIPARNEWTYMYRGFLNWGYPQHVTPRSPTGNSSDFFLWKIGPIYRFFHRIWIQEMSPPKDPSCYTPQEPNKNRSVFDPKNCANKRLGSRGFPINRASIAIARTVDPMSPMSCSSPLHTNCHTKTYSFQL